MHGRELRGLVLTGLNFDLRDDALMLVEDVVPERRTPNTLRMAAIEIVDEMTDELRAVG